MSKQLTKAKTPKVIWVDSWRDIPFTEETKKKDKSPLSTTVAYCDDDGNIYAIKGKTPLAYVEHEKYHILKGHATTPRTFERFLKDELEATKYAYEQTKGQPKHILSELRALYNDGTIYIYKVKPNKAIRDIGKALKVVNPPQAWLDDYNLLVKEVQEREGQNTIPIGRYNYNDVVAKHTKRKPKRVAKQTKMAMVRAR